MRTFDIEFNVAMDAEQKEAGIWKTVKTKVTMTEEQVQLAILESLKPYKIKLQGNLRTHWTEWKNDGFAFPAEIEYGKTLYAGKTVRTVVVVKPPTEAEMKTFFTGWWAGANETQKRHFIATGEMTEVVESEESEAPLEETQE